MLCKFCHPDATHLPVCGAQSQAELVLGGCCKMQAGLCGIGSRVAFVVYVMSVLCIWVMYVMEAGETSTSMLLLSHYSMTMVCSSGGLQLTWTSIARHGCSSIAEHSCSVEPGFKTYENQGFMCPDLRDCFCARWIPTPLMIKLPRWVGQGTGLV